jgi:probable lipoprotein NlpC
MQSKSLILLSLLSGMVLLGGCAGVPSQQPGGTHTVTYHGSKDRTAVGQHPEIYRKLTQHFSRWKGTPYQMGGMDKSGIDCSGFVYVTFRDALGIRVPRTTESLATYATTINRQSLKTGDLVFFITGRSKQHVGIYIGHKQFIHASTSSGVMKSSLNNPYWTKHYWKSARILNN